MCPELPFGRRIIARSVERAVRTAVDGLAMFDGFDGGVGSDDVGGREDRCQISRASGYQSQRIFVMDLTGIRWTVWYRLDCNTWKMILLAFVRRPGFMM